MNLVIVESPAKCKTIAKYLNKSTALKHYGKFVVVASMGHIRDLPKKELGIDVNDGFKTVYKVTDDKKKTVEDLRGHVKKSSFVWLATDADLEGAAISNSLKAELKLTKYKRIVFTEITQRALESAILNAGDIDYKKVEAQETRRILDRLVGFKLSPLLWKNYKGIIGLSAGRVQSAALAIIVNRDMEIDSFKSQCYWYGLGDFVVNDTATTHNLEDLKLHDENDGGKVYKCNDKAKVETLVKSIGNKFYVAKTKGRIVRQSPDLPFITSSLQQEANNKFGFTIKRTMALAQELYENGHITYMRTDSYNISDDFTIEAKRFVENEFGASYLSSAEDDGKRRKTKKNPNAQEAHEAIRPTDVTVQSLPNVGPEQKKLYEMIWKRAVAYFMKPAVFDELELMITEDKCLQPSNIYFIATFKKCKFNGYLVVYGVQSEKYDFEYLVKNYKSFKIDCKRIMGKNTWSNPPSRFNESSIIKVLESEGIGRPSTYASILGKLYDKQYVIKSDTAGVSMPVVHLEIVPGKAKSFKEIKDEVKIGNEKTRIVPTDIGKKIFEYLDAKFTYILDRKFTAHMEADLDNIEHGEKSKLEVLTSFWNRFGADVAIEQNTKNVKESLKAEQRVIVVDGTEYIVRLAKYGPVIQQGKTFIGLKPYLKYFRKEYTDINEDDIRALKRMPINLGKINGVDAILTYGPFGYYVKYGSANVRLTHKVIQMFIKEGTVSLDDVKKCIEYKKNNKKEEKTFVRS
jgi:DNA topoisomerase I